jgi:hypothetical protein
MHFINRTRIGDSSIQRVVGIDVPDHVGLSIGGCQMERSL